MPELLLFLSLFRYGGFGACVCTYDAEGLVWGGGSSDVYKCHIRSQPVSSSLNVAVKGVAIRHCSSSAPALRL